MIRYYGLWLRDRPPPATLDSTVYYGHLPANRPPFFWCPVSCGFSKDVLQIIIDSAYAFDEPGEELAALLSGCIAP